MIYGEAGAGYFSRLLEIEYSFGFAQFPMGFRFEVEFSRLGKSSYFHVVAVVLSVRHAVVDKVGDKVHKFFQSVFDFGKFGVKLFNSVALRSHFRNKVVAEFFVLFLHCDFRADFVFFGFQCFHFSDYRAAFFGEFYHFRNIEFAVSHSKFFLDQIYVVANES